MPVLEDGQIFERYRIVRLLGSGIAGESYEAEDRMLLRKVTLKRIHPWVTLPDAARRQFFREMQGISTLNHPYLASILDYGEVEGSIYVARRYVSNGSLLGNQGRQWFRPPLPVADAFTYAHQLAQALHYVHQHGYLHGSLTLANVLVLRGANMDNEANYAPFLLSDPGLSNFVRRFGSPRIDTLPVSAAPEQLGKRVTTASDQFALGVLLYFWLAGRFPYVGSPSEVEQMKLSETITPLSTLNPGISLEQDGIILRALTVYPEDRHASVLAFTEALIDSLLYSPRTTQPISLSPFPAQPETPRETFPVSWETPTAEQPSAINQQERPELFIQTPAEPRADSEEALTPLLPNASQTEQVQEEATERQEEEPVTPIQQVAPPTETYLSALELLLAQPRTTVNLPPVTEEYTDNEPYPDLNAAFVIPETPRIEDLIDDECNSPFTQSTQDEVLADETVNNQSVQPLPQLDEGSDEEVTSEAAQVAQDELPPIDPGIFAAFRREEPVPSTTSRKNTFREETLEQEDEDAANPSAELAPIDPSVFASFMQNTQSSHKIEQAEVLVKKDLSRETQEDVAVHEDLRQETEDAGNLAVEPDEHTEGAMLLTETTENEYDVPQTEIALDDAMATPIINETAPEEQKMPIISAASIPVFESANTFVPAEDQVQEVSERDVQTQENYQPALSPRLIVTSPFTNSPYEFLLLNEETNVGRAGASDLLLDQDNLTSRHHALIKRTGDHILIFDKRSNNGVFINGQKIEIERGYELADGDHISIGNYELIFRYVADGISQLL
jgi:serine/threonine protein kinase